MRILITRLTCVCETLLGNIENNSQALNLTNDQHNCNQKSARMLSKQQYASHKSWTVYANESLMRSKIVNRNKLTNPKKKAELMLIWPKRHRFHNLDVNISDQFWIIPEASGFQRSEPMIRSVFERSPHIIQLYLTDKRRNLRMKACVSLLETPCLC